MTTTAIEDQLAEVRRRIYRLQARAKAAEALGVRTRTRRHLDALAQAEAAVHDAAGLPPDEVEDALGQLKTRLDVAERSLAVDLSDDWPTFTVAVKAELHSWDTYLERLQASAAAKAWKARERAEAAIGEIRSRRIAVDEHLARANGAGGAVWQEHRTRVTAARDELERKADELSASLT